MKYILSSPNVRELRRFARGRALVAFDFDGTLAPVVREPAHATMRRETRRLLRSLTHLYPCTIISGRARADVTRRCRGVDVCSVVGNHGAEPFTGDHEVRRQVQSWLPTLHARLAVHRGVVIEDKGFSVAVHYRNARRRDSARRAIVAVTRRLHDARVVEGKLAVNLVVPEAPHKGVALERERRYFACETALYVGDDATDEDAFRSDRSGRLFSVRIGRKRTSAATHYLRNQREIDRLLQVLVALRNG